MGSNAVPRWATRSFAQSASGQWSAGGDTHGTLPICTDCALAVASIRLITTPAKARLRALFIVFMRHPVLVTDPVLRRVRH
ncbi:MAG: hypothetical protein ACT4QD_27660 [Acidobacteriota bacterium]